MKNYFIALSLFAGLVYVEACKGKEKKEEPTTTTTNSDTKPEPTPAPNPTTTTTPTNEPKTYTIVVTPDTAVLGKSKEAFVKIKNLKAVELSEPDGKSTGIEISYDIELTNRNKIGGYSVQVVPNDFRLELDNGTKISHQNYNSVSTPAESTASSTGNIFRLPAGTKPTALNLFYDETRVSLKMELK